jgi:hypothetical protein
MARSVPRLTTVCATALTALIVLIVAFHSMPATAVVWLSLTAVGGVGLLVGGAAASGRRGGLGASGRAELTGEPADEYRRLTEEYRRLADLAITAQEHTDLKLSDVSAQLDHLRGQVESLQRILSEVE